MLFARLKNSCRAAGRNKPSRSKNQQTNRQAISKIRCYAAKVQHFELNKKATNTRRPPSAEILQE